MSRKLLCFIFLFLAYGRSISFSQECKFEEDGVDKFTGAMHRVGKKFVLASHLKNKDGAKMPEINCELHRDGNDFILKLGFKESVSMTKSGVIIMNYATGDKIILLLQNKETIEIPVSSGLSTRSNVMPNYLYDFTFNLSIAQKLKSSIVTDVRIVATFGSMDFEVGEGARKKLQHMMDCMMR